MLLSKKFIGGLLLIIGTSIGAGMLALPVATAQAGFMNSLIFLVFAWAVMLIGALYILEVNLWFNPGANMVTMAQETLGIFGKSITWSCYLFLLYTLLCGYIAGGGDVFHALLTNVHFSLPQSLTTIIYVVIFALIVFTGMKAIDNTNSFLMYVKMSIFILLLFFVFPHIEVIKLKGGQVRQIQPALMLLFTAYGFAIIIPSLREYFHSDVKKLKALVITGSLFPLICYIAWNAAIMGVIAKSGHPSLYELWKSAHTTSELASVLGTKVHSTAIGHLFRLFSSISMLTAFLGVSLCLFDFLADSLKLARNGKQGLMLLLLVFTPPLLIVLAKPDIYLRALSYAGFFCIILLLLLPALMAGFGRTHFNTSRMFKVFGGKGLITLIVAISLVLLLSGVLDLFCASCI